VRLLTRERQNGIKEITVMRINSNRLIVILDFMKF
jgi:hypothetical protein